MQPAPNAVAAPATKYVGTQARVLELLGSGVQPTQAASALGVSEGYISQLLAEDEFARQVAQKRYDSLLANTARDAQYDDIEDALLKKLKASLPYLTKVGEILGAIKVINGAKRRGASVQQGAASTTTVIQLTLPEHVRARFTADASGQVVEVATGSGSHSLVTIQSGNIGKLLAAKKDAIATAAEQDLLESI